MSLADRLGFQAGKRLHPAQSGRHLPGAEFGDLHRVQTGVDERAGHLGGQRLGTLIGPHEVVTDGVGDVVFDLCPDFGPVQRGVAGVDDLFGVLGDGPEPRPQVVVDIGGQIGDAVVEDLLPQGGLL